jgi:UDP-glucose 4-epimerase
MANSITAIILAGGLGTRLRPLTDTTPKPLLPIKGKPIIQHAIENFKRHGITDIVLSIGYKAETIMDYFKDGKSLGVKIRYCVEKEPLGTGGAIKESSKGIKGTFIAINGDNLVDFDWTAMLKEHRNHKAKITMALYPVEDVTQYGIAKLEGKKIIEFVEKPAKDKAPSNLNNAGGYIIEHDALDILPQGKSSIERDCFENLAKTGVVYAFTHQGQWFPTDTMEKYAFADKNFTPLPETGKKLKILVTGGAGFIGSHIVEHFQDKAEVVVFDNLSTGSKKNLDGLKCVFVDGDVTDYASVEKVMVGVDYVFHLAAFVSVPESLKHPAQCFAVNVGGTENVLKAALKNKVKKVVLSSSCAVYGDSAVLPKKESMAPEPKSPYAKSKLKAEQLCEEYSKKGLKTCCLRFFNVFGPRQDPKSQYAAVIPIFIDNALNNHPLTIFGDGKQTRDFIYVKDVVHACVLAMEKLSGVYNVGTGKETSLNALAKLIVSAAGSSSKIVFAKPREGDILRSYGDTSKINAGGFSARFSIEQGLKETIFRMRQ